MEVTILSSTEQEVHATVQVRNSNFSWLLSAIYASPRYAERQMLWNNLIKVAELHNMPWVLAGDFNEPIIGEDKFGGRPVSVNRSLMLKECLDKCSMARLHFGNRSLKLLIFSNAKLRPGINYILGIFLLGRERLWQG